MSTVEHPTERDLDHLHGPSRYARGGLIPAVDGADSIQLLVSPGCFWVSSKTAEAYSADFLERLNCADTPDWFTRPRLDEGTNCE